MDNVGIVVDDLDAAVAFFTELGMELEGRMPVEGIELCKQVAGGDAFAWFGVVHCGLRDDHGGVGRAGHRRDQLQKAEVGAERALDAT